MAKVSAHLGRFPGLLVARIECELRTEQSSKATQAVVKGPFEFDTGFLYISLHPNAGDWQLGEARVSVRSKAGSKKLQVKRATLAEKDGSSSTTSVVYCKVKTRRIPFCEEDNDTSYTEAKLLKLTPHGQGKMSGCDETSSDIVFKFQGRTSGFEVTSSDKVLDIFPGRGFVNPFSFPHKKVLEHVTLVAVCTRFPDYSENQIEQIADNAFQGHVSKPLISYSEASSLTSQSRVPDTTTCPFVSVEADSTENTSFLIPDPTDGSVPLSDVVLKSQMPDSSGIRAHKTILGKRSRYFSAMFTNGFKEDKDGCVVLKDVSDTALRIVVHLLYGGRLDMQVVEDPKLLCEVWRFAETHEMDEIAGRCVELVHGCVDAGSWTPFFKAACDLGKDKLQTWLAEQVAYFSHPPRDLRELTVREACCAISSMSSADVGCWVAGDYIVGKSTEEAEEIVKSVRVGQASMAQLKSKPLRDMIIKCWSPEQVMELFDACLGTDANSKWESVRQPRSASERDGNQS